MQTIETNLAEFDVTLKTRERELQLEHEENKRKLEDELEETRKMAADMSHKKEMDLERLRNEIEQNDRTHLEEITVSCEIEPVIFGGGIGLKMENT